MARVLLLKQILGVAGSGYRDQLGSAPSSPLSKIHWLDVRPYDTVIWHIYLLCVESPCLY